MGGGGRRRKARRVNKYGRRDRRATLDSHTGLARLAAASVCRVKSTLMAVFYIGIDLHIGSCGELEVKSSMFSLRSSIVVRG